MRILIWHVHGAWTTAFVHGAHTYLIPTLPDRSADGRGRAETYSWPPSAIEVSPEEASDAELDVVVLQRPEEVQLAERWLGSRKPGRDIPAVYVEHNAPQGKIGDMRHPLADRTDMTVIHVTHFNRLFWDTGSTPATVIEHGVPDPGYRYDGSLERAAVVVNEPVRRGRVTGTDLLPLLAGEMPLDLFGIGTEPLGGRDLPQAAMHGAIARRRAYVHPYRWTSLGLSLIEAMLLGLPVVCLATTEAAEVVPRSAGVVSNDIRRLQAGVRDLRRDRDRARAAGLEGRRVALERFSLARFLADWDDLLARVAR